MTVKPIRPEDIAEAKGKAIPPLMLEAVNELIALHFVHNRSEFTQDDLLERAVEYGVGTRQEIFDNGWLNIESIYEAAGWSVTYDKPGYNESYKARFIFMVKPR